MGVSQGILQPSCLPAFWDAVFYYPSLRVLHHHLPGILLDLLGLVNAVPVSPIH